MTNPYIASLQVPTDIAALQKVLAWFSTLERPDVPQTVWWQCQSALAEGFTNAVRHAHRDQSSETPIMIQAEIGETSVTLRVWDFGYWFNLQEAMAGLPEQNFRTGGGRGLQILMRVADHLSYDRQDDGRNCLTVVKYF